MEINYQPLSAEAFIRSMNAVAPVTKMLQNVTPTVTPISAPHMPQIGATPPTEPNSINWVKILLGALAVAGACYIVYDSLQDDRWKD
jgi:hypothetical protein